MSRRDVAVGLMWGWAAGMATNLALGWLEHATGYNRPESRAQRRQNWREEFDQHTTEGTTA